MFLHAITTWAPLSSSALVISLPEGAQERESREEESPLISSPKSQPPHRREPMPMFPWWHGGKAPFAPCPQWAPPHVRTDATVTPGDYAVLSFGRHQLGKGSKITRGENFKKSAPG